MRKFFALVLLALLAGCAAIPAPTLKPFADSRTWVLVESLPYSIGNSGMKIVVPAGFATDVASIPQPLWGVLSPHDYYSKAALIHDYLYWTQLCTREQADNLLLIAMKESGVSALKRNAVYAGVRAGGQIAWNANQKERAEGLPRVIPRDRMDLPPSATWSDYRKELMVLGVKDPGFGANPSYCALGNTTDVP